LRKYCSRFLEEYFCNDKDFHRSKGKKRIKNKNNKIFIAEGMAENFRVEGTASWF
jgi:hypothetical protein